MSFNSNITPGRPPLLWSDVNDAFVKINENFDILVATIGNGSGLTPVDFSTLDSNVSPTADNTYTLGEIGTRRWKSLFLNEYGTTGTDNTNGIYIGIAHIQGLPAEGALPARINLPASSMVDGVLIKDPNDIFFRSIQIDNNNVIVPSSGNNDFNLLSGDGIELSVNSSSDSITIDNTGILSVSPGTGMLVSTVSGIATVTNDGVRSLSSTTALPSGRTLGAGINISATKGDNIRITNTGILSIQNGVGISVSTEASTGIAEISVNFGQVPSSAFTRIHIDGDSAANDLLSDTVSDTFNIEAGYGILLSNNPLNDTLSITFNNEIDIIGSVFADNSTLLVDGVNGLIPATVVQGTFTGNVVGNVTGDLLGNTTGYHTGDIKGSVFGDDSTKIVDAVENKVYGGIFATTLRTSEVAILLGSGAGATNQGASTIAIGGLAGNLNQGTSAVAVGVQAGTTNQGVSTVAIGALAGNSGQGATAVAVGALAGNTNQGAGAIAIGSITGSADQGANAIAIGALAGSANQPANSIVLNASGTGLNGSAAGFFVDPIRNQTGASGVVQYDSTTKEISYSSSLGSVSGIFTGNIFTNLIDSADSSAITVTPSVIFNTQVTVEGTLTVNDGITGYLSLTGLKAVVAASADFADFQARIAALV